MQVAFSTTERVLRRIRNPVLFLVVGLMIGCSLQPPTGIKPVAPFDVQRYTGTWYEIARLDHAFERGLTDIRATYRFQPDGSIQVINRGYDADDGEWREAIGKAFLTGNKGEASLKVSFFGPFYGGYHVAELDAQYRWALIVGPNRDYFWILARDKQLPQALLDDLIQRARLMGIATDQLIYCPQSRLEH